MKKSIAGDQSLILNLTDFEKAGVARKSGHKFSIQFTNGRVDNVISSSQLAKDLAATLLQDEVVKDLFSRNDYVINMNMKYHLGIKFVAREETPNEEPVEASEHVDQ